MSSDKVPGSQTASLTLDTATRHRGRMGLAVPWENIPWWGIIIRVAPKWPMVNHGEARPGSGHVHGVC
ncbi:MAG: hypothetical protein P8186_27660 [Anaerolineae bacterium]